MEETDRYGLFAQYDFELTGASLKNMASVRSQLSGLEKGIARVADAVNKSDFGRGLESASRRAQKSTSKAGTEIDELAQSLKLAEKRLKPLKREFRALRAEVRNIDFGELGDKAKFRQAAREVKNYVATLKTLESQIEGNTAAEREFAATLKAQQRISSSKLEMQMQQRNAALSAQRIGEFSALRDIGRNALIPINQEIDKGVSLFSSFDDSMASVGAVSRATEKEMEKLRQTAKKLGASTRYTSFQAAEAEKYLATAGFKTAQILGTVSSALELASAGELDLARSADISSNILSGFRLKAEQLSSVVDTLALTSASANTNIEQLGVAMTYAAPPASLFGASIEETSAFIGVMSNAGVQADKAGTAARSAFLRLASPVKQGKVALDSLGISTIDSSGNLRNFVDLMSEISDKLALDPETLKKIQMAGGDLELIENAIPDSKKIEALKGIFGTTGISGATAALTQMAEFKRLSLANLASSSNTDQLTQYFAQMGVKVAEGQDIFTAISEQAPDYQTAASLITQVNAQLMQSNLQTLSSLQRNKLYEYFKVSKDKDLFAEITRSTQDSQESVARLNTAMSYLGVEMKVETRAARQMAKTMEDNLAGSFRALASAAEAVYINLIEPLSPILGFVVDGITKVLLVIANAPYPIRLLIGSVVGLTAAMAATAVAVGTVGFFLFSFSQAAATAAIASQTLASGLIPLTGFFQSSMLGFIGTNPLETFFQYNTELVNDFSLAWKRTSQKTVGGLEGIYKAVVTVTKATFLLSRAFLFSPITLWVGSFLLLNAFIEQAIPGFNLLGSALSLVTAPLGFIWGLIKGIGQSLMEALGIVGGGTIGVLAAPIHTFTNALNNALETFKSFSDRGEELGLYLGRAIIAPIENAAILIDTIWQQVLGGIQLASMFAVMWIQGAWQGFVDRFRQILQPVVTVALTIAQQLINALNHNPTERIPEAWHKAVTLIKGYLSDLLKFAQDIGNRIAETGIAIATYFQNLIQSIANTVGVIGMVFRIVGKGISLLFKAFVFIETKAIQGIFLLGEATIWLYKTLFTVGLQAIDILKKTYDQAFETIQIFSSAFGYGEFSPDDRAIARQTLILGTLNAIGNAFGYIAQGGTKVTDLFHQLSSLVIQSINNFDLLTLALMTAASLPMTLIGMLDETAHLIVPELAILTQPGLFRALVYALPGIIATATATGITQGFQDGVAKAIAKLPDQLISKLDWANKLVPPELRDQVDFALSEIFNRPINTNEIYLQTRSFLDNQFRAFTDYLLQVGETIKESSVALRDFLKPILEYDFGLFDIQTIPIITTIAPAFQAIVEVFKSPTFAGVLQYLTFTVLPALGQTILAIAEYLNNIRLIITLPFVSVVVRMIQIVTEKIQFLIPQISNLGKTLLALSKTLGVLAVQGIAAFLRTIPYVGTFLANNFLLIVDVIATSFPIYINLLKRFISVDMLKALIPAYAKVVKGIATGIIYMFEQGFKPLAQLLFKALNPLGTFKLLNLYIKTQGFKGIIKTPPLLDFFGVLNFINPFDVLFSVSKDVNAFVKIFSDTAEFSYDMVLKKQTMLFQSLRTNNPAFFKYMRMGALIPLEELLEQSPFLVKFFVQLTRGLMMISPIVQIVGRIALAFTVWYQILKPVNEEMLSAIASTEVMGYKLKLLADTIRVLRFLVVDGSDAFIWFAFFVPKAINAVVVAFRVLGDTAYYVLHDVIALGILGFNALKITVINPLVVALIGATVALRAFLTVVQYALIFIRLKTQQYGDAIQKGFGAVMQQIASDVWGVISFLGIQLSNAFVLITSAVHRAWKSLTGLVGAIAHEIYLILVDPVGEFNRLLILLVGEVNNQIERTGTLLDRLPFKSLITLVQKYWKELVFAGGIALQFVKALSPAVRISLLLVDLALALVNEYTTGFKRLDTIIQVLSHPIALLDSMIKGLVNFLQGGFIPLDAADWISKFIAGFIKMIPVVMGGFFVVALLIKRDVGGAFQLVSDKVLLFIGRIIQAVDAVKSLGYSISRIYKGDLVQMNLLNTIHGVRSKDNFGPIQNPFAYSQDPVQQQVAIGIGEQRKQKAKALLSYQKELDYMAKQEQKRAERELIRQARTNNPDLMNPEHSFYMDSPNQPGVKVRMSGAQVEKRRNRFGIERYTVTQLGRSVMGAANQGYNALRYGESYEAEEARKKAAEKSGLAQVYQEYHGQDIKPEHLGRLSATTSGDEDNMFTRNSLAPLLRSFQDFFENIHIKDFKVNELYVGHFGGQLKATKELMTPSALDYQINSLLNAPTAKVGLTQEHKKLLRKYLPSGSLPTAFEKTGQGAGSGGRILGDFLTGMEYGDDYDSQRTKVTIAKDMYVKRFIEQLKNHNTINRHHFLSAEDSEGATVDIKSYQIPGDPSSGLIEMAKGKSLVYQLNREVSDMVDRYFDSLRLSDLTGSGNIQETKRFQLEFQKYQAKMIAQDMGSNYEHHFSDFSNANLKAMSSGDAFAFGGGISTGFDVITQGLTNVRLSATRASSELTDELGATRKSLMSLIVESTGIPKMLESLNINTLLGRQVRGIERNVNRNNRQAEKFKRLASYHRETGLRAFLSNQGHTDSNLDAALTNYGAQYGVGEDTISVLKKWKETGKFQRGLSSKEKTGINEFSVAMKGRLQGYNEPLHEDYKIKDLDSLARMLNRLALDKTKPDFNSGHVQDFVKFLESGISTDGKNGVTEDKLKEIAQKISNATGGELNVDILKEIKKAIGTGQSDQDKNKLFKIIRQAILSDKRFDRDKFFVRADKDAIAKEMGFRYESQLRKIGETKLTNPIQQLKQSVRDYIFQFEENMLTFHQENMDTLDRAKEFLLRRFKLEKLPFGNIAGRLDSIINAYSSFADKIKGQYLRLKGTGKENLGKMSTFFNERINFKSSIDRAISKFRTAKAGNFEGFLEMVGERQKTKVTRRSFQADFYQQMLTSGVDQADARKAMLALYKRQGDNKTLRQEMSGLDLNETAIASVEKVLSQITNLKQDEISRHLMDKKGLSLKGMMPVQFYIAQEIPGILKGMFKDVRAITGAAIKVSKIDKIIGKIFTDVAAGLQQTIAPKMSSFVFRQARILSGLSLSVSNIIRRTFGENAVEKWFVGLSKTLFDSSKKLRADIKTLGKDSKSYTAKLLDAGLFLFKTLSNGIVFAAKALSNPKSIWASIQGFFGKVKNFFGKLFPKRPGTLAEVDQEIIRNQKIRETGKRLMNNSLLSESTREKAGKAYHSSVQELGRLKIEREALTSTPEAIAEKVMGLSHKITQKQSTALRRKLQIESVEKPLSGLVDPDYKKSAQAYEQLQENHRIIREQFKTTNKQLIEGDIGGSHLAIPATLNMKREQNKQIKGMDSSIEKLVKDLNELRAKGLNNKAPEYIEVLSKIKALGIKKKNASYAKMSPEEIMGYDNTYDEMELRIKALGRLSKQIQELEKQNPDLKKHRKKSYSDTVGEIESQRSILTSNYENTLAEIEKLKEQKKLIAGRTSPFLVFMTDLAVLTQKVGSNIVDLVANQKSKKVDLFKQTAKSFKEFKEKVTPEISKIFANLLQRSANVTIKLSQHFQNAARRSAIAWRRSQREVEGKTWPGWLKAAYRVGKTLVMTLNHGTTDVISEAWGRTRIAAAENMQQMVESAHEAGTGIQRGLGQSLEKTEGFFSRLKAGLMDWAFPVRKINRQIEALKPAHQAAKESYESQKVYTFKDERKKQQKYQKFDSLNSQIKQLETQKEAEQMMNRLSRFMGGLFPGRQFKTPQQYPKLARIALKRFNRRFGNFFGGLFKDKSKHLQLPAMNFSSPRINVGKSMEDASRRVVLAWKRAGREIRGKEWPTLIKAASRVGKTLVNFLNHGAADVTAQAWENTQQSSAHSMHQMAQTAHQAGGQIQSTFERAINKTIHLFGLLGKSVGNVGRAGMAIGGVVSATGFAAQSVFYSLSNIGLIDEETSQSLYKVTELISIFGAITGLGTPLIMAFTSSVSALGTVAATVGTAVMGLGRALSITVGLGASPFAPLVLGIGAVSLAIFGLYKAFQSNFLGIRDIIQNTLVVPIEFIQSAWEGFVAKFGGILTPIVKPALDIAQNLINALNHNPTERIPEAWEGAITQIKDMFGWLIAPAEAVASGLTGVFGGVSSFVSGLFSKSVKYYDEIPKTGITDSIKSISSQSQQVFDSSAKAIPPKTQQIVDSAKVVFSNKVVDVINVFSDKVESDLTQVISALNNIANILETNLGVISSNINAQGFLSSFGLLFNILVKAIPLGLAAFTLFNRADSLLKLFKDFRDGNKSVIGETGKAVTGIYKALSQMNLRNRANAQPGIVLGSVIETGASLGDQLRPIQNYIPALGILFPKIAEFSTLLLALSHGSEKLPLYMDQIKDKLNSFKTVIVSLMPLIKTFSFWFYMAFVGINALIAIDMMISQFSIFGTVIGSVAFVLKAFFGFFKGIFSAIGDIFKSIFSVFNVSVETDYFKETLAIIKQFAEAGENIGYKLGYGLVDAFLFPFKIIGWAWQGFVDWFARIPLVDIAMNIATGLINALNHNPTEKIPQAWEGAVDRIKALFQLLINPAQKVAGVITGIFSIGSSLAVSLTRALLSPIDALKSAWLGFSEWFSNLPLVGHALNIATGLINALNHNPTERIPEAWDVATNRISGMLDSTVTVAQKTGQQMTTALSSGVDTVKSGVIAVRDNSVKTVRDVFLGDMSPLRDLLDDIFRDNLRFSTQQIFSVLVSVLDVQNQILAETRKVVEQAIAINTAIQEYTRPKPIVAPEKGEKVAKSNANWFDHLFNNPMSEQIALRQNQLIQEMVNNSKSSSLSLSSEFSKYVFKEEKTGKTELTKEGQIYLETKLAKEYRDHEGAFSKEFLQYFASKYGKTKDQIYQEGLQKQPIIKEAIKALPETQRSLTEKQSTPGNKIAGKFNPLGQEGFLGIGGNQKEWREDYTTFNSGITLGGIERDLASINDIVRYQRENLSKSNPLNLTNVLDFFQGGEASIRDRVRQQMSARQNQLIYEMANNSISESSALRSEFSKYITRGKYGKPELTQEGQVYLETKLAKEYRDRQGAFSNEILEYFAGKSGKTVDQVYDIGLQGQPIIREAIKALPDQEKSLAEKIAPQIDRVVQAIDQTSKILSDILNEFKIPDEIKPLAEIPIQSIAQSQPKQGWWDNSTNFVADLWGKVTSYFDGYYAKTKIPYKIPQKLTEPSIPDLKNNIVPYRPKSVGDVVNPIIKEKTSKLIPVVQQKASQIIPAAQQAIGGLAQRWQQHRKSKPVVDDLMTNAETEWDNKESWWEKNFKSIRKSWGLTSSTVSKGIGKLVAQAPDQGYELQKGLAEGSPGPTFYIRKYWKKTINQVTDWMGDLADSAAKTGISLAQSMGVGTVETAIAITPFVSEATKNEAIQSIEAGIISIQDRYDYLEAQGFGNLGVLFEPGAAQVTDALQLLGGDIADFAKRSVNALLTLNFGELAQASKDFGGNLAFALKGLTAGFNSMGLSAIAAGAAVLTGMAPAIITIGAIAFGAAVILANFLGIRSILKGVIQILVATGKIVFFTFMAAGRVLKGFSLILRGLFGDSELIKQGIAEIKGAFQVLGQQLKLEFKAIAQGFLSIGEGLKIALVQIFPFLKQPLQDLKQWFDEFWSVFALSPEWAGRMAAEALIDFVKNIFRAFNNLRLSIISTWQKMMVWFQIQLWEAKDWIVEVFRKIARLDFSFLQDIPNTLLNGFKWVAEKIPTLFQGTGDGIISRILKPIRDGFNAIAQFVKGFSDRINEELQLVFPGWMKSLGQSIIPLFDTLSNGAQGLREAIINLGAQWIKLALGFDLPIGYPFFEFLDSLVQRFQSTVITIEKAWLQFFVNAGKLEWNQITEDIGNTLKSGFKSLTTSVGQYWNQLWSTVLEAPTLKGKVDAFMSNFSFLSILNYVDDVAIAFDKLREKVGQVTSWLSNLIGTWNQVTDKAPKLKLDIDTASLETKANNLIDNVQGKWNQLVKFFENPKWPTARQTWQGLLDGYGWLRSQFRTITDWFGRTPEMLAPFFNQLKLGADKVSEFLFNMELQWVKLVLAFNLPLPMFYRLFEFINAIPKLFKAGVIQIETSWTWLANEISTLNWKTLTHVWEGFSKLFGLFGTSLDFAENKWREFQSYILTSPQFLAPVFEAFRNGLKGFSDRVVNLSEKWENFATRFHLPTLQGLFTELFAFSERFQGVLTGIETRWEGFATWLGTTELFSYILGGLKNLSYAFSAVTGFISRHWNTLVDFLRSTQLLVHLGNGIVLLIEFVDNLSTTISNLKQRWNTFLETNETTVKRIKQAWEGFTTSFKTILKPIVDFALDIAQKLINALNHNPTERIPEAWRKAVEFIQGKLSGLLDFAKDIGKQLISALVGKENVDKFFGNFKEIKDNIFDLVNPIKILEGLGQGIVSVFNLIAETLPKLLNPMKLFNDVIGTLNYAMGIMSLSIPEQIPIWRSLFVVIGENLVSAFKQLDQVFLSVLNSIRDAVPGLKPFLDIIDLAKEAIQSLVTVSTKISFDFSFGFLEGFATKLEKINQTFSEFNEPLERISKSFKEIFLSAKDNIPQAFSAILDVFRPILSSVDEFVSGITLTEKIGQGLGAIFADSLNLAVGGVKNAITVFADLLDAIAHPIQTVEKLGDVIKSVPSEAWKVVVEATRSAGEEIRLLMGGAFDWVSEKISSVTEGILSKWRGMFDGITSRLERFTGKTKVEGKKEEQHLSNDPPGPTYMIRKKWFEMLDMIEGRVSGFTAFTRQQGQQIQSAMTASPQLSLANQISQYSQLTEKLSKVARLQNEINQRRKTDSSEPFSRAANRATVKLDRARTQILQEQSTLIESLKQSDLVSPRHLSQLDKQQARLNEIALAQQNLNQRVEAGNISRGNAQGRQAKLDRQQIQALERQSALLQEIQSAQQVQPGQQNMMGGLRGSLISIGSLLSNFAPQLATPLFVLNDFIDAFVDIKALLPTLQAGMLAWGNAIAASNSFVAGTFTILKAAALKAYKTLLVPILPFLPIILGVIAAVGLFYLAFKSNFLGIRDLIYGVGWAFKKFFGDLFGGFFAAIGSIFTTIDREVRAIASIFGELVSTVISIFDPILKLFNVDVNNSVLSLSNVLSAVVNALLFPIRILVKSLNFLITSISWGIQLIVKSLIFTVNVIKTILSFTWEVIKSILIIGATIGGIVAVLNFGALLAGIVSAAASVAGLIGTIGGIISGIITGITFIVPFLAVGLGGIATVIGGAIASAAVAFAPIIAGIAVVLGIAFVIKKIFEGIWWVISSIAKGILYIITSDIVTFVQDVFSGISNAITGLVDGLKVAGSFIGNLFSKIGQGINTVVGWIMAPVNLLVYSISSLFNLLSNPLGFLSNIPIIGGLFGGQPKTEKPPGYATGGLVEGSGTSTGDRIHAKLSPGEYVINASSTKANLPLLDAINTDKASVISTPQVTKITDNTPIPAEVNGIAFEVEKIFEGISQVISSIGKGIWDIITNPMQALANIGTFIQDVFSGILNTALGFIGVVESVGTIFWQIFSVVKLVVDIISIFNPAILLARTGFMLGFLTLSNISSVIEIFEAVWQIFSPIVKVIWDIFVKSLVITVDIIKVILPFVWELVKSILIIGATVGGIFAVLNFGVVLAGIVSAFATIAGLVGSIGVIFGGIVSGVMLITPLLITGVASVLTMIGSAVVGVAISLAPVLPIILLISGVCAAIIGVAFVIKKIFEGIWWVISSVVNSISSIPFVGSFFGGQPKTEKPPGYATGGLVKGPGTRTGDRIHAKLSPGEYVINAIAAKANLPLLHSINAARAGMMPTPQIMAMPAFAPIPFFPPTQSESAGEQEININLSFGDIIVNGDSGDDLARDFIDKLRSPQVKMEIRQIMREFVERMR
jgi:TP901 family phage tail tape measure protein